MVETGKKITREHEPSSTIHGSKKALETPNCKSSSLRPRSLKYKLGNVRGSSWAIWGAQRRTCRTGPRRQYERKPLCMRFSTDTMPAHCSWDRISPPLNSLGCIFWLGLMQRMKDEGVQWSLSMRLKGNLVLVAKRDKSNLAALGFSTPGWERTGCRRRDPWTSP